MHPVLFHLGSVLIPSYGAMAALGVLLALFLAPKTARAAGVHPVLLWNLCVVALFAALAGSRLLLVLLNWTIVRTHPVWLLRLAMIHHPLLTGIGALLALAVAVPYARWQDMPLWSTADALAAPLSAGLACEQIGELLAGSGFGTETHEPWAVIYTQPLAAFWSGAPMFVPLHPVQAYTALAFFLIAIALLISMLHRRQQGDVAGLGLLALGAAVYITEFWRDPEGRGSFFHGALDGPQLAAIVLVLLGALVLLERKGARIKNSAAPSQLTNATHSSHAPEVTHE